VRSLTAQWILREKVPAALGCTDSAPSSIPFSPSSVQAGAGATVRGAWRGACSNPGGPGEYCTWGARVTVDTSCGVVTDDVDNTHRLVKQ
jgi:hypothetical protein